MVEKMTQSAKLASAKERKQRNDSGRYTLEEALEIVLLNTLPKTVTKSSIKKLLKKMIDENLVKNWSDERWIFPLPLYRGSTEELRWDELNDVWLSSTKIEWRFPNPADKMNVDRVINHRKILHKDDWIAKAQKYGEEILISNRESKKKFTQKELSQKILDRFNFENIKKDNYEEYKLATILRVISGEWFKKNKNLQG